MTTNFKESNVSGTQWSRCNGIHINNPYGAAPTINVQEETLVAIEGLPPMRASSQHYSCRFDPASTIALRNPETDELTGGTITQGEVYAVLYSLYRQLAEG